jgi:hypothetical protein
MAVLARALMLRPRSRVLLAETCKRIAESGARTRCTGPSVALAQPVVDTGTRSLISSYRFGLMTLSGAGLTGITRPRDRTRAATGRGSVKDQARVIAASYVGMAVMRPAVGGLAGLVGIQATLGLVTIFLGVVVLALSSAVQKTRQHDLITEPST